MNQRYIAHHYPLLAKMQYFIAGIVLEARQKNPIRMQIQLNSLFG